MNLQHGPTLQALGQEKELQGPPRGLPGQGLCSVGQGLGDGSGN